MLMLLERILLIKSKAKKLLKNLSDLYIRTCMTA